MGRTIAKANKAAIPTEMTATTRRAPVSDRAGPIDATPARFGSR
jgi:hypothetical protein